MYLPGSPENLMKVDENTRWLNVIGVVKEVRLEDLAGGMNNVGAYYFPWDQSPRRGGSFAIRTSTDSAAVLRAVRAEVGRIDPELPLYDVRTMEERTANSLMSRRAAMVLAMSFGVVALFLSAIGIYGVLAFVIGLSRREIAIRLALGATRGRVIRLIVRQGMTLVAFGIAIGLVVAYYATTVLSTQLFGVTATDPLTFAAVPLVLAATALAASYLPSRAAARIDPQQALKSD